MTNTFNLFRRLAAIVFFSAAGYATWFIVSRWVMYLFIEKAESSYGMVVAILGAMSFVWIFVFAVLVWLGKTFWVSLDKDVA
jgi:hypothetical protein